MSKKQLGAMRPDIDKMREHYCQGAYIASGHPGVIMKLLAYIDELESCTAHTTSWTIGETEWAHRIATLEHMLGEERENVDTLRAAVEHAEQRFVDEYDARKAAEREIAELKARIVVLEASNP